MLLSKIAGFADIENRARYAKDAAQSVGCTDIVILIPDPEIGIYLPAPGFPQTLPLNDEWQSFIERTLQSSFNEGTLPYPDAKSHTKATGVCSPDGAVAVILGGHPSAEQVRPLSDILPLLSKLLSYEQRTIAAESRASFAEKTALKAETLTRTIDGMRLLLKDALIKQQNDKAEIEQLLKKKDEFLNIASHELKTPMTSLKAYMQLLQRPGTHILPGVIAEKSLKQMERLEKLIADLLDVSKITNGKLVYNMQPFDLAELLSETVESIQVTTLSHKLIIESNPPAIVHGDRARLDQVLINYLTNAIKYSPNAEKVIIHSSVQNGQVTVSIQDFGIGIEQQDTSNLFEQFYRVENTVMKYQGMGLGLYVVAEILKRHNGKFWFETSPGKGSKFFFSLPLG